MPTLALIMERTAMAFGLQDHQVGTARPSSSRAVDAQRVFAWLARDLTGADNRNIGMSLAWPAQAVEDVINEVETSRRLDRPLRLRLDRLAVEICAEARACARLKLSLPADPDPAITATRLLAGGATAASVSEDAMRGLALAFLATAASTPSTPVQEASNHG